MQDVDNAIAWSIRAERNGLLVINDYIGPTRLQWRRSEVRAARQFLTENASLIEIDRVGARGFNISSFQAISTRSI